MRIIQFNKDHENILEQVANDYGIDKEKLWDLYLEIMRSNYFQDLADIARENEDYLKGE